MEDRTDQARTEETNHFARDFTERTERAAQANINVMHMWQAGADAASKVTAQSTDQAAHAPGFGDDAAEKAAGQAVVNAAALTQSASVLTDSVQAISSEWVDFVRHSTERSMDYMAATMRCRSPSDFVHAQADAFRDNVEMLMDSNRRIVEIALRTAGEASHVLDRNLKLSTPAEPAQEERSHRTRTALGEQGHPHNTKKLRKG